MSPHCDRGMLRAREELSGTSGAVLPKARGPRLSRALQMAPCSGSPRTGRQSRTGNRSSLGETKELTTECVLLMESGSAGENGDCWDN